MSSHDAAVDSVVIGAVWTWLGMRTALETELEIALKMTGGDFERTLQTEHAEMISQESGAQDLGVLKEPEGHSLILQQTTRYRALAACANDVADRLTLSPARTS